MNVLVAYATKHGATEGIAERIAVRLIAAGLLADVKPCKAVGRPFRVRRLCGRQRRLHRSLAA